MDDGTQVYLNPIKLGPVSKIASYSETIYMIRRGKLALFDGKSIDEDFIDWGHIPDGEVNDIITLGNRLYIGTNRGLGELRGAALTMIKGEDGLPVEATTCLARGFDQDLWIGTERGVVRMTKEGKFHYFGPGMWLPDMRSTRSPPGDKKHISLPRKESESSNTNPSPWRKKRIGLPNTQRTGDFCEWVLHSIYM